jgi:hypothetical protein
MPDPLVIRTMADFKANLLYEEAQQMRSMARRWRQVETALIDQAELTARRLQEDGLSPAQKRDAQYLLERSQSLYRQAQREFDKYTDYAAPLIETQQRSMAKAGINMASAAIRAVASDTGVRIAFDILPVDAVEFMVGLAGDGSPLTTLLEGAFGSGVDGMFTELIRATALGKNPRETAQRMVREGFSQSLSRMLNVSRSEQMRVFRESSRQQFINSGVVEGYRRLATRSATTCSACLFADGEEYALTESLREHASGRCSLLPTVTGFRPVQWQRGPDWFRQQSPDTQKGILGKGKYEAWKAGKFDLDQLVSVKRNATWGDSVQPTPLRELTGNAN